MRFVHTSDWHLGKILHQRSLLEDQEYALAQLRGLLKDSTPDALVVAGDIYDRAVPPPQAVRMLDDFLHEVAVGLEIPVLIIAGNHDSPDRLGFASRLLADGHVHIAGALGPEPVVCVLEDEHGPVHFHLLPYADPATVQLAVPYADPRSHEHAMAALVAQAHASRPKGARSVAVAHAFVAGGSSSDSERVLTVGGSGLVAAQVFDGFDYVALGHLHGPQKAGGESRRYCGSLLKYSFSEHDHAKGVDLIELAADGSSTRERLAIKPMRDMRKVGGELKSLCENPDPADKLAYLQVQLTDRGALYDAMGKLRDVYPHVLDLRRDIFLKRPEAGPGRREAVKHDPVKMFEEFFKEVGHGELNEEHRRTVSEVFAELSDPGEAQAEQAKGAGAKE